MAIRPAVLRPAAALQWTRSGRWTPTSLAQALSGHSLRVKRSDDCHFMYTARGRDRELLPDISTAAATDLVDLDAAEFFGAVVSEEAPPYLYHTSVVSELSAGLLESAPGWEHLGSVEEAEDVRACRPWLQLWAGSAGATTQAHYDVADNVFVQLSGRKRFWLWGPSAAAALHVFPDAHPRSRKAQVDVASPDTAGAHPLASSLSPPLSVVLEPGDALSIPAFWFHHVTCIEPCVSLNVFSESSVKLAASEALGLPLPLHAAWPAELKRRGLAALAAELLALPDLGVDRPAAFIDRVLIDSRYAPLPPTDASAPPAVPPGGEDAPRRRRVRRRRPPPPPAWEGLRLALAEHAAECHASFARLREAVHEAASSSARTEARLGAVAPQPWAADAEESAGGAAERHVLAVRELTLAHLLELWTLRLFGPDRVERELRALAEGLRGDG